MNIRELLAEGKRLLSIPCASAYIDSPALDAMLLLSQALGLRREEIILRENEVPDKGDKEKFFRLITRRKEGECIAYILGRKEFRGLDFTVNHNVLVPRPDTETLIEAALEYIDTIQKNTKTTDGKGLSILDLCTGSGALAVSLKSERPFLQLSASDISAEALEIAAFNAKKHLGSVKNIRFIHSNLFESIRKKFNIILSNPPYIASGEISLLAPEVRREPRLALDGGIDGLELIRKIITQAPDYLQKNGVLLLEADLQQMQEIKTLLEKNNFTGISIHKDLAGKNRVISAANSLL